MGDDVRSGRGRFAVLAAAVVVGGAALVAVGTIAAAPTAPPANTALPAVSGTPQVGQTLTTTAGTWANEPASFTYAWRRCNTSGNSCSTIGGATAATYVPVAADVGRRLRSRVIATNALGSTTANSAATAVVAAAPVLPQSTALPVVSGTAQVGQTLTTTNGTWSGGPTSYTYAWARCNAAGGACTPIPGATASSYVIAAADAGLTLRSSVTAANGAGPATASSAATAVVQAPPPPPVNSVLPTIAGLAQAGQTLSASTGTWSGAPTLYGYQWRRCDAGGTACTDIAAATTAGYIVTVADVGATLRVRVTASNAGGPGTPADALATAVVTAAAPLLPVNTSLPQLAGAAQQGQTMSTSTGTWTNSPTAYGIQWRRCDAVGAACADIAGATAASYVVQLGDVGSTLRSRVTASNGSGPGAPVESAQSVVVGAASAPVTFGATAAGASAAAPGAGYKFGSAYPLTVAGTATTFEFWARGGTSAQAFTPAIYASSGTAPTTLLATGATVTVPANQAAGWVGSTLPATALPAGTYYLVLVSGATSNAASIFYAPGVAGDGVYNANATSTPAATFGTPSTEARKWSFRVQITPSGPPPSPPVNSAPPTIAGTAAQGQALTASPGTWTNGPTAYAYQWRRCDPAGSACTAIAAATAATYALQAGDVGATISVRVTASNAGGPGTPADALPTAVVTGVPVPVNTVAPVVSGTAQEAQILTTTAGTWTGAPTSYAIQWRRCDTGGLACVDIAGATSTTYLEQAPDVGSTLRARVVASNAGGPGAAADSAATPIVTAAPTTPPASISAPVVTGSTVLGQTLTTTQGTWSGSPTTFATQWRRCDALGTACVDIPLATATTYSLTAADVGSTLRSRVTATAGSLSGAADSAPTTVVTTGAGQVAPTYAFTRHVIDPGSQVTTTLGTGDIDGDGDPDVVVGGLGSIGWFESGTTTYQQIAAGTFGQGAETVIADLDGDGRRDVIVGENTAAGRVTAWFARTAAGGWQRQVLTTGAYCHDLKLVDLDANGSPDAVCLDQNQSRLLRLTPGSTPTAAWTVSVIDNLQVMGLAIGDIDRDGRPDVVAGRNWYRNTGTGWTRFAFTTLRTTGTYPNTPDFSDYSMITLTDLDGDNRLDIFATLFAESPEGRPTTFLAPADPTTQAWTAVQVDTGSLFGVHTQQAVDYDGSGRAQVLVAETNLGGWSFGVNPDPQVYLYRLVGNPAQPGAWERTLVDTIGTHEGRAADLDGDGLFDLAGHEENTDRAVPPRNGAVVWWENRTEPVSRSAPVSTGPPAVSGTPRIGATLIGSPGTWADSPASSTYQWQRCTADGTGCAAIPGATRSLYRPVLADQFGTLRFRVTARNASGSTPATSAASAPVLPDPSTTPAYGFARQQFTAETETCSGCESPFTGAADLNGDGRQDIISGASGTALRWYEAPSWTSRAITGGRFGYGNDIGARDLDGDGRRDIVTGETLSGPTWRLVWLRQNADATWTKFTIDPSSGCHELVFKDANGDGRTDIYCASPQSDKVVVYFAPADPTTGTWPKEVVDPSRHTLNLCVADIDADGTDDVFAGRAWYKRSSGGTWTRYPITSLSSPTNFDPIPDDNTPCAILDLNGDGRLDVLGAFLADSTDGQLRAFFQPADPTSTPWPGIRIDAADQFGVHTMKIGDFDHSGRLQVLVAEQNYLGWGVGANPNAQKVHLYRLLGPADQAASWQRTELDTLGITEQGRVEDFTGDGWLDFAGNTKTWTTVGGLSIWTNTLGGTTPPVSTALPVVTGTAQVGQLLTGSNGTWTGGPTSYAFQWLRCNAAGAACVAIAGATLVTYTPVGADQASTLRLRVTANAPGGSATAESLATAVVAAALQPPASSALPVVSGTAQVGQALSTTNGTWTNTPTSFAYQWLRCNAAGSSCATIPTATQATYLLAAADQGSTIRARVTAANTAGPASADSAPTGVVQAATGTPPQSTALPVVTGTARVGQALTGTNGSWSGAPTSFAYQWLRCDTAGATCVPITTATLATYTLAAADQGATVRLRVSATNGSGTTSADSDATATVQAATGTPPANTALPIVSGTAQVGQGLTGTNGTWSGAPTSFAYQWLRCDAAGATCAPIGGAGLATYTLTAADQGATIRLRVTASNASGPTSAASAATGVVQASATGVIDLTTFTPVTEAGCAGCTVAALPDGTVTATIAGAADTTDTAYGSAALAGAGGLAGRVYLRHVLAFASGQAINANLAVLQVRDVADALVYEIYIRGSDRQICLWSPAGGLRSTSINTCSGIVQPNDGTTRRIEVAAQVNASVILRIDGVDAVTTTGLTGGTTGAQRTVRAGIDHYDGSTAGQVRVVHSRVAASTVTWVGS